VPTHPGVFSAWGMLAARPRIDFLRSVFGDVDAAGLQLIHATLKELEQQAVDYFELPSADGLAFRPMAEMRYRGQEHSVAVDFSRSDTVAALLRKFNAAHAQAFSFDLPDVAVEITAVHLHVEALTDVISVAGFDENVRPRQDPVSGRRKVYLGEEGWVDCTVYARDRLGPGEEYPGPALIEEVTTTTLVLTGQKFHLDGFGQLIITSER
jgi:N-methylhydantoinase A